jgi:hypothetical protein
LTNGRWKLIPPTQVDEVHERICRDFDWLLLNNTPEQAAVLIGRLNYMIELANTALREGENHATESG